MIWDSPVVRVSHGLRRAEKALIKTIHKISPYRTTAEALRFIFTMKTKHPSLIGGDARFISPDAKADPATPMYFALLGLVDVIVPLQFQRGIVLANVQNAL